MRREWKLFYLFGSPKAVIFSGVQNQVEELIHVTELLPGDRVVNGEKLERLVELLALEHVAVHSTVYCEECRLIAEFRSLLPANRDVKDELKHDDRK